MVYAYTMRLGGPEVPGGSIARAGPGAGSGLAGMALLSAAVLLLQVALTRVFSIAQSYHFAFLVISLALLGFGASGSLLAVWPRAADPRLRPWLALGFAASTMTGYLFVNLLAFDSYRIAWDGTQTYLLIANLLALAIPFVFAGALVGGMLSSASERAGRIYGANLLGSGLGAVAAPLILATVGSERAVIACAALATVAALALSEGRLTSRVGRRMRGVALIGMVLGLALMVTLPQPFEIQPSPYKRLSQLRRDPDARILATRQNAYSRLDIVESPAFHSAPGLSLAYTGELPPQAGLVVDGSDLLPVADTSRAPEALAEALPVSIGHALRPGGDVLLLGSGGGMDAWVAATLGARSVTVVEPNELVYGALTGELRDWAGLADHPRVQIFHEQIRSFAARVPGGYDLVELTLADEYRPISSGAFTLTENNLLTVDAVRAYLRLTGRDGLLVMTRWIQAQPTESLRVLGLITEALDGADPRAQVISFRTFQTVTFLVKPVQFTAQETDDALAALDRLRYDLVLAPRIPGEMLNRYARLERPIDHELALDLLADAGQGSFYRDYEFDVSPSTDDRPFFFHFFRWEQTPAVIENLGRRWQPFGGSGYFVLLALLLFALTAAALFVLLPLAVRKRFRAALADAGARRAGRTLGYFIALGLAFLLVEVVFIQRFMLVLAQPTLALAAVVGPLLVFSGLGSLASARIPWRPAMIVLAMLIGAYAVLGRSLVPMLLELPLEGRVGTVALLTAPVGFLMGIPFARGIAALSDEPAFVPWAWAANGGASVVSGVLAAALSLSLGFTVVLLLGAGLYLAATMLLPGTAALTAKALHPPG
jgi:spermidine synthase